MKKLFINAYFLATITIPQFAFASWLSEITGIDVDLNRGRIAVKAPNIAAVPQMIQNLPKDVGQALLNPAAPVLATAIRFSRGQALNRSPQLIPADIKQELAPYFPAEILNKVRWTTANGVSIDGALKNWLNQEGAVTLDEVIVFSGVDSTRSLELWAHEITHVMQYSQLGVETFAFHYSLNWNQFEKQARDNASRVIASVNASKSGNPKTWAYEGKIVASSNQATWEKMNTAARKAINPTQCLWINNQTNTTGNNCPISIMVTGVVLRRMSDGFTFTTACNEPTCLIGAGFVGPLLSPPGHLVIGVTGAYEL